MKLLRLVLLTVFSTPLLVVTLSAQTIVGTYELVSRKLPDGKVVVPPEIVGLFSITPDRMNFNIHARSPAGKAGTFSTVSSYRLNATELTETRLMTVATEEGKTTIVEHTPRIESTKVKTAGGRIEFTVIPFHGAGPTLVFDVKGLVATKAGEFVDTWERRK